MSRLNNYDLTKELVVQPNLDLYNVDTLINNAESSMTTQQKAAFLKVKDLTKLLIIEKIYLIEILKDIYCMWRQPFCTNPSICPGNDFWIGAGLTQKGAETIGYLFNNFKQDNNIQALLEKHILLPEIKSNNSVFQDLSGNNRTKLIPTSVSSELRAHKSGLFRRSWTIWLTTRFFSLCVKIHPKRNIPTTDTQSLSFQSVEVVDETANRDTANQLSFTYNNNVGTMALN